MAEEDFMEKDRMDASDLKKSTLINPAFPKCSTIEADPVDQEDIKKIYFVCLNRIHFVIFVAEQRV